MDLVLFNTMGRKKEKVIPIYDNEIRLYTCGPTVYNYAHIGNLRTYIFEDILKRTLLFKGYKVKHVMNVTDIGHLESDADEGEDKIEKEAKRTGKSVLEIARFYEKAFFNDLEKLNILKPDIVARATEHINDMIELIKRIEKNGYAYFAGGNLYFDVKKFKDYGKLAGLNLKNLKAGARIEVDKHKKSPYDFVLWFTKSKYKNHILNWDSPWGEGFPGWHIECSAMSMKYLGEQFDIHCGGIDHIPVHHTNEIAQSEAATGKKWVNYWLHGEFLVIGDDEKMSKSAGNFITLKTLMQNKIPPLAYRFFVIQAYYRKKLTFTWKAIESAKRGYYSFKEKIISLKEKLPDKLLNNIEDYSLLIEKINNFTYDEFERNETSYFDFLQMYDLKISKKSIEFLKLFTKYIFDDLNTPNAISVIMHLLKSREISDNEKFILTGIMDKILGFNIFNFNRGILTDEQKSLIIERDKARKNKDYKLADEIRNKLALEGIILQDTPGGTKWFKEEQFLLDNNN